jgi:hypothetical protein
MFKHPDASTCQITIEIEEDVERVLTINTHLSLWPTAKGYDEERVSALAYAAQEFRADRRNRVDRVRLVSISEKDQ